MVFVGARGNHLPEVLALINYNKYTPLPAVVYEVSQQVHQTSQKRTTNWRASHWWSNYIIAQVHYLLNDRFQNNVLTTTWKNSTGKRELLGIYTASWIKGRNIRNRYAPVEKSSFRRLINLITVSLSRDMTLTSVTCRYQFCIWTVQV